MQPAPCEGQPANPTPDRVSASFPPRPKRRTRAKPPFYFIISNPPEAWLKMALCTPKGLISPPIPKGFSKVVAVSCSQFDVVVFYWTINMVKGGMTMEMNELKSNERPPVVLVPGGVNPAAISYGPLL